MGLLIHLIPSYPSICSNSAAIDQWAVFFLQICLVKWQSDRGSHTQLLLNRIYAPSHLRRGGVPKMSDKATITQASRRRSPCVKARTMRTSQKRFTLSNLKWMCRNHDEQEERACKMGKRERQREDWGQAAAEKLSFTLVNKQGGWGEQSAIQQY